MPAIPPFAIGSNWATVSVTALTVGTDGTLTPDGTAHSVVAQMRRVNMRIGNSLENITAMGRRPANNVAYESATSFTLEFNMRFDDDTPLSASTNPLAQIMLLYDYVMLTVGRCGIIWTYYGICEDYEEEAVKERATGTINFSMADIGGPNPTIA